MAKILLIETSTALCSVALAFDGKVVASRRSDTYVPEGACEAFGERAHAAYTAVFCDEVLREAGLKDVKVSALDAVCISEGPGSYTGLRVGLSTAKGICFVTGCKLLSICSLDVLAAAGAASCDGGGNPDSEAKFIIPMMDARRMEVYTATYEAGGFGGDNSPVAGRITPVEAKIIEHGAFADIAPASIFIGDGALKCREAIGAGKFIDACPCASDMAGLAEKEFAAAAWRDVAYFEPFYLKDFVATTPKKML